MANNNPQGQQPQPPAIQFSLVPAMTIGVLDYTTRQGLSVYHGASSDPSDLFNVDSSGLQTFMSLFNQRAIQYTWDMEIPQDVTDPHNNLLDFIPNHGRFTIEHIRNWCTSFVNIQSRAAQDNMQQVNCILASLSLPGFRKINTWHDDWHVGTQPAALLLLKVIIRESYIDTQATTRILREHLSSLPSKLEELKGDID